MKEYFKNEDELKGAQNHIENFHGDMLISSSLDVEVAVLLCTYMLANKNESKSVAEYEVEDFFEEMGRKSHRVSRVARKLSDQEPKKLECRAGELSLTYEGIKVVREHLIDED